MSKFIVTWGNGSKREDSPKAALTLAKRKSGGPFGASVYRADKPGRGTLIYTCARSICVAVPKSGLSGFGAPYRHGVITRSDGGWEHPIVGRIPDSVKENQLWYEQGYAACQAKHKKAASKKKKPPAKRKPAKRAARARR